MRAITRNRVYYMYIEAPEMLMVPTNVEERRLILVVALAMRHLKQFSISSIDAH